jgi:hypothetical protein
MIWNSFRRLLSNPMSVFIYGILGKWYLMIAVASLVVTFWVFKGLEQAGVLQEAQKIVTKALLDTKSVARYCTPKIANLRDFWDCVSNPPLYEATPEEASLETQLNNDLDSMIKSKQNTNPNDPYDSDNNNVTDQQRNKEQ